MRVLRCALPPRQEDFERYTLDGQEKREEKMPPDGAICALGRMFAEIVTDPDDRLVLCILAIMIATGFRIGEVLTMPLDCEVFDDGAAEGKYGLRYHKEKAEGREKECRVCWLDGNRCEIGRLAVEEARRLTQEARNRALVLEGSPGTVPVSNMSPDDLLSPRQVASLIGLKLQSVCPSVFARIGYPGKIMGTTVLRYLNKKLAPLWVFDRGDGTRQMLSESLFIAFHNAGHVGRGTNPLLVERSLN